MPDKCATCMQKELFTLIWSFIIEFPVLLQLTSQQASTKFMLNFNQTLPDIDSNRCAYDTRVVTDTTKFKIVSLSTEDSNWQLLSTEDSNWH